MRNQASPLRLRDYFAAPSRAKIRFRAASQHLLSPFFNNSRLDQLEKFL